ncbi:Ethanolamine utilization protein [Desulfosporosinus sp. I2]|uniref:phosphate propanoyltransferase n=1 Tax=Desulfosporosinus sp. I2 TaxID=1617025 RepID=UPI0005ED486F|nr:phosphate propanoyltransferase [Desulfosporosinus sp. I2]KJR45575.1 Ethanolamine utilization protein [Desulfosporosinus sp. I2]
MEMNDVKKVDFKREKKWLVMVGVSRAHVHLSQEHVEILYGKGSSLTVLRDLGQAGQFAAKETVNVVGPKGVLQQVRIIGPARSQTQVELSRTETFPLGINAPLRDSGRLENTPGAVLIGPKGVVVLDHGCIISKAHVHMLRKNAEKLDITESDKVSILIKGEKTVCYHDVTVRLVDEGITEFHIDTDEANAAFAHTGDMAMIIHKEIIVRDNFGNIIEVDSDNIKFVEGQEPNEYYTQEGIRLMGSVFEYPESVQQEIKEKLLKPQDIAPNKYYVITAIESNKVFGIACFYWMPNVKMAYLEHLGITPEYKDRGIGVFLFHRIRTLLEKKHPEIEGIFLEARKNKEHLDDRKQFFLDLGAIPIDTAFYSAKKTNTGEEFSLMFKPETSNARLDTSTMEVALQTISRIL